MPPNSTRILYSWGLEEAMRKSSAVPKNLFWRRWENGKTIAHTKLNPQFEEWFGVPYHVTHRAHLHAVLHQKTVELGVPIKLATRIERYQPDLPCIVLADGTVVKADLILAADGNENSPKGAANWMLTESRNQVPGPADHLGPRRSISPEPRRCSLSCHSVSR